MARNPFGGKKVSFAGCTQTLEEVMGREPIAPTAVVKKIWAVIKKENRFK